MIKNVGVEEAGEAVPHAASAPAVMRPTAVGLTPSTRPAFVEVDHC